jgi:hypothetical protein
MAALCVCVIGFLFCAIFFCLVVMRWFGHRSTPQTYNTAALLQQVQTLSEFVTVKYVIEKVEILEDKPQNPLRAMLPDDTKVILVAHGIVKAGIDFSKMQPADVSVSGNKLKLRLPSARITDAYLDESQTKVIERNTSFLRDFNKNLEQNARVIALDDIRRAARTSGILKDADDRARSQLTAFFHEAGLELETVSN